MNVSKEHEEELEKYMNELKEQGFKVIKVGRKIPDAIAVKRGKVFAVEMMGKRHRGKKGWTFKVGKKQKLEAYAAYDGVLFRAFKYPPQSKERGYTSDNNFKER